MFYDFRRDRGALLALLGTFVTILLLAAIGLWSGHPTYDKLPNHSERSDAHGQENHGPQEGYWAPEFSTRDTYAQWLMMILAAASTGVSWLAVKLVRETLRETRRGNDEAAQIAFVDQRPWVDIAVSGIALAHENGIILAQVDMKISNLGKTPALRVEASAYLLDVGRHHAARDMANLFYDGQLDRFKSSSFGTALLPNGKAMMSQLIHTPTNEADYAALDIRHVMLGIFATYSIGSSVKFGQTGRFSLMVPTQKSVSFVPTERINWTAFAEADTGINCRTT